MGCLQSKPAPEKEIDSGPKVYSWDKRAKSPESTKAKFFIRERIGLENAIHRNDVKDAPITIDACRDTIIFLEGQIKNLIIDECTNVAVVAFVQDSTYIRNSVNCHVILVTGQLRTRDCRQLRLCLHCPTQPGEYLAYSSVSMKSRSDRINDKSHRQPGQNGFCRRRKYCHETFQI